MATDNAQLSESLYREEFYILWRSGINDDMKVPLETVFVCNISINDGDSVLIHVFHSETDAFQRAEEKFLEWIPDDPYVNSSRKLDIEIFTNHSPLAAFSVAFSDLKRSFEGQGKEVRVEMKIVRVTNTDGVDRDSLENREGLRDLAGAGVNLLPVTGKDWQYLRQILRRMDGLRLQETRCRITRSDIHAILSSPFRDRSSSN